MSYTLTMYCCSELYVQFIKENNFVSGVLANKLEVAAWFEVVLQLVIAIMSITSGVFRDRFHDDKGVDIESDRTNEEEL